MKAKLTKQYLEGQQRTLKAANGSRRDIWDETVSGLFARVSPRGIGFFVYYRTQEGRQRKAKLGSLEVMSVAAAREQALAKLGEVVKGGDPTAERRQARATPTVRDLVGRYLEEHAVPRLKVRTVEGYRALAVRYMGLPGPGEAHPAAELIAGSKVDRLDHAAVNAWHRRMGKDAKGAANRALALLSSAMNYGVGEGIVPANPCRLVKKYAGERKENFLRPEQRAALDATLDAAERGPLGAGRGRAFGKGKIDAFRFLALTGMRLGEVLSLRWGYVDTEARFIHLPESKTGRSSRPLSKHAAAFLEGLRPDLVGPDDLVFTNEAGNEIGIFGMERAWRKIRAHAKLPDGYRIHDLRHSFASDAIMAGAPLQLVGKTLGHKSAQTTERYAHIADAALRAAADMTGEAIERNTQQGAATIQARGNGAEVVELAAARGKRRKG